jgi:hypothetical protein
MIHQKKNRRALARRNMNRENHRVNQPSQTELALCTVTPAGPGLPGYRRLVIGAAASAHGGLWSYLHILLLTINNSK